MTTESKLVPIALLTDIEATWREASAFSNTANNLIERGLPALRALLATPATQPDPIIGVLKSNLAEGVRPSFSGGDLKHLIKLLETPHAEAAALREELAETIQSAWDAAGGNPGIKATRDELISALRLMDAADDEHAKIEQRLTAAEQLLQEFDSRYNAFDPLHVKVRAALNPIQPAENALCLACDGAGSVSTGIAEASSTICNKCDGTGTKP